MCGLLKLDLHGMFTLQSGGFCKEAPGSWPPVGQEEKKKKKTKRRDEASEKG